jgi:hypothetical protein
LFFVIGIGNTLAGALVIRNTASASVVAFGAGTALVTWIISEMILLRETNALQLGFLIAGLAIMFAALRRYTREHPWYGVSRPPRSSGKLRA